MLLRKVADFTDTHPPALLDFLDSQGLQGSQGRPGEKQIQGAGYDVPQPGERDGAEETKDQQGVQPPDAEVGGAGAGLTEPGKSPRNQQAHRGAESAETSRLLPDETEAFQQIAGHADAEEDAEHPPVASPVPDAGRLAGTPPQEVATAGKEEQAEDIERELVDDIVDAAVEREVRGNHGSEMIDLQQGGAQQQDHESGEQQDVGPARRAAAADALLAETVDEETAQAGFDLGEDGADVADE